MAGTTAAAAAQGEGTLKQQTLQSAQTVGLSSLERPYTFAR